MWSDNISKIDMLAYEPYADLVSQISVQEGLNPLTVGLIGSWGSGKSTLLNLICEKVESNEDMNALPIVVNAWMFEGYDDAKTALMDSILFSLQENETIREKCESRLKNLIKKVDWIRVGGALAKKGIPVAASIATGNPVPAIMSALNGVKDFDLTKQDDISKIEKGINVVKGFLKEEESDQNIVENVRSFRNEFTDLLKESNVDRLVVLIDDLDRCNPDRIMETLEAIKLFLAVENTTFIIAIDEEIVKYSIKRKYPKLDSEQDIDVAKDYIEKVVQIPIKLPELSELEIKNYMMLLICEMFLKSEQLQVIITKFKECGMFSKGEIISSSDILDLVQDGTCLKSGMSIEQFKEYIETFSKIGDVISYSTLKGNPRQTKRFLNMFFIRKQLAEIQKIDLNISLLAKLMVLEYTDDNLFKKIYNWQFGNDGIATKLQEIEEALSAGNEEFDSLYKEWSKAEIKRWLSMQPVDLGKMDLRQYFYLSRDAIKDKEISLLNISLEERKIISELCSGIDSTLLGRKIDALKVMPANTVNNVVKGFVVKYRQTGDSHYSVLIELIRKLDSNKEELVKALKETDSKYISPPFLLKVMTLKDDVDEYTEIYEHFRRDETTLKVIEEIEKTRKKKG